MRLTIIPVDSAVYVDGDSSHQPLDLSKCGIPANVHALQWYDTRGWIEFIDMGFSTPKPPNEEITELPLWAEECYSVWQKWTPEQQSQNAPAAAQNQPITSGTQTV